MTSSTGREALVSAFDRLFDKAATKLRIECSAEEKDQAKEQFLKRFAQALKLADSVDFPEIPEPVMAQMEAAIDELTPASVAGYVAAGPLAMQVQAVMRQIALRAMQDRMLENLMEQADNSYGGN